MPRQHPLIAVGEAAAYVPSFIMPPLFGMWQYADQKRTRRPPEKVQGLSAPTSCTVCRCATDISAPTFIVVVAQPSRFVFTANGWPLSIKPMLAQANAKNAKMRFIIFSIVTESSSWYDVLRKQ